MKIWVGYYTIIALLESGWGVWSNDVEDANDCNSHMLLLGGKGVAKLSCGWLDYIDCQYIFYTTRTLYF